VAAGGGPRLEACRVRRRLATPTHPVSAASVSARGRHPGEGTGDHAHRGKRLRNASQVAPVRAYRWFAVPSLDPRADSRTVCGPYGVLRTRERVLTST
jgi:hypothetical protein